MLLNRVLNVVALDLGRRQRVVVIRFLGAAMADANEFKRRRDEASVVIDSMLRELSYR